MFTKSNLLFSVLFFIPFLLFSQSKKKRNFLSDNLAFTVVHTQEKILADGILNEAVWTRAESVGDFSQRFPIDTTAALAPTEIKMTYDDENLYVAVICRSKGGDWLVPSLRRDYGFIGTDNITLMFDTFKDQTNAFVFGMNARGVRREALVFAGGRNNADFSDGWDNKWRGDATINGDTWTAEFVIPFKTLRFAEGATGWRFSAYRYDTQHNEISLLIHIPNNFTLTDLTYMADMNFETELPSPGRNMSVIPYVAARTARDFENVDEGKAANAFSAGGDAKIGITSGLNLDLTANPDFSQVEVDRQVTNLNRFEIFFPERRQFFLENADLFSSFGTGRSQPFFSRRIGISRDTATNAAVQNTIYGGARLTGKINDRTRIGFLTMQTAAQPQNDLPSFNYGMAVYQKTVGERSNFSLFGINKQAFAAEDFSGSFSEYNRILGAEYNLSSPDNHWRGKFSHQQAITPSDLTDKFSNHFFLEYSERDWRAEIFSLYVGAGYDAEVGFVQRRDIYLVSPEGSLFFYPENGGSIVRHTIFADTRFIYKIGKEPDTQFEPWKLADVTLLTEWSMQFRNFASLSFTGQYDKVLLFNDFDPTREQAEGIVLPGGRSYEFFSGRASFRADRNQKFTYSVNAYLGGFFNGTRVNIRGDFGLRFEPYGSVSLSYNYNYIKLAEPFLPANLWLVGPRFDLTLSKKLFFTTFVQYNSQSENLNINARLQWRFQPVSDFFLVWTDNYASFDVADLRVRNRALVAKVTYWLNL